MVDRFPDVHQWLLYARAYMNRSGSWRQRALAAMLPVVEAFVLLPPPINVHALDGQLREAFPFGSRQHYPYKAWLEERRKLLRSINHNVPLEPEQYGVVEVARDLVQLGREDEAKALLAEQCPRLLERDCPACGVRYGHPCRESVSVIVERPQGTFPWSETKWVDKVIPCESRIVPKGVA